MVGRCRTFLQGPLAPNPVASFGDSLSPLSFVLRKGLADRVCVGSMFPDDVRSWRPVEVELHFWVAPGAAVWFTSRPVFLRQCVPPSLQLHIL